MKTTGWKDEQSVLQELSTVSGSEAFYLSAPFLLSVAIIGILPWVAG